MEQTAVRLGKAERVVVEVLGECVAPGEAGLTGGLIVMASCGRISRGGVYPTLAQLEKKGLVESEVEEGRPSWASGRPRKFWRLKK